MLIEPTSMPRNKSHLLKEWNMGVHLRIAYNGRAGTAIVDKTAGCETTGPATGCRRRPIGQPLIRSDIS